MTWRNFNHVYKEQATDFKVSDERLGKGGFATVWKATFQDSTHPSKFVAAKRPDSLDCDVELEILIELSSENHPHIVKLIAILEADTRIHILFELLEGGTLKELLLNDRPAAAVMARIAGEISDGLVYVHEKLFIHRDIKPANILFPSPSNRTVKIIDFGAARKVRDPDDTVQEMTQIGTWPYWAPEIQGGPYGQPVDIYSLGCIILFWILGQVPAETHDRRLGQVRERRNDSFLWELAQRCILNRPEERPSAKCVRDMPDLRKAKAFTPGRRVRAYGKRILLGSTEVVKAGTGGRVLPPDEESRREGREKVQWDRRLDGNTDSINVKYDCLDIEEAEQGIQVCDKVRIVEDQIDTQGRRVPKGSLAVIRELTQNDALVSFVGGQAGSEIRIRREDFQVFDVEATRYMEPLERTTTERIDDRSRTNRREDPWTSYFQKPGGSRPAEFYTKCLAALSALELHEPGDLVVLQKAEFEEALKENSVVVGVRGFLLQVFDFVQADPLGASLETSTTASNATTVSSWSDEAQRAAERQAAEDKAAAQKVAADRAALLRSRAGISDKALKELCKSSRPLGNGDRVLIHGVTSARAADFNFKPGCIEKQDADGRFEVFVLKDGMKSSTTAALERHNLFSALSRQDRERFLGLVKLRHGSPSLRAALPALLCNLNELLGPVLHISSFFAYPWECLFQFGGYAGVPRDEQWRFTDFSCPIALRKKEEYQIPSKVDPGCVDMGDGRVFFTGGCGGHPNRMKRYTDDFRRGSEIYDALTEIWRKVADMPTRRHGSIGCRIGTKVYVLGGSYPDERDVPQITKFCDVYDIDSETWSSIPAEHYKHVRDIDFGGIAFFAAGVLEGRIVVLCNGTANVLAYNPEDGWRKVCRLPEVHDNACSIIYKGEFICASGRPEAKGKSCVAFRFENSRFAQNWWEGEWRDLPNLVLNRVGGSLAEVNGKLYITGGYQEDENKAFTNTVERLDADEWVIVPGLKIPRGIHAHENFTLPHLHPEEGSGKMEVTVERTTQTRRMGYPAPQGPGNSSRR